MHGDGSQSRCNSAANAHGQLQPQQQREVSTRAAATELYRSALPPHDASAAAACGPASKPHPTQLLKCPRCDSMDTKFCYYNNYSLMQPRYFCKTCKRYWTAGGALRNVPVGGGLRKNKRSKQRQQQIVNQQLLASGQAAVAEMSFDAQPSAAPAKELLYPYMQPPSHMNTSPHGSFPQLQQLQQHHPLFATASSSANDPVNLSYALFPPVDPLDQTLHRRFTASYPQLDRRFLSPSPSVAQSEFRLPAPAPDALQPGAGSEVEASGSLASSATAAHRSEWQAMSEALLSAPGPEFFYNLTAAAGAAPPSSSWCDIAYQMDAPDPAQ